jgi:hypothetical protein
MDMKVMLYTIGVSFTGEMAVKGAYESTIGNLTAWVRGDRRTPEDDFALAVAEDYARFLRQTPWYEYPFGRTLVRFWRETPFSSDSLVRSIERRFALSAEYGVKVGYAWLIGALAGFSPAELTIQSVWRATDLTRLRPPAEVTLVQRLDPDNVVIETPRYRAFTDIVRALSRAGGDVVEIAGNRRVLITVLASGAALPAGGQAGVQPVFAIPIQARPGWHRLGLDVEVLRLSPFIRERSDVEFEHIYDY